MYFNSRKYNDSKFWDVLSQNLKFIWLVFGLVQSIISTAQTNQPRPFLPFVVEGKSWLCAELVCHPMPQARNLNYFKYVIKGDTTIFGHDYKKVFQYPGDSLYAFMRDTIFSNHNYSTQWVYFKSIDTSINNNEYFLYGFNFQQNGTYVYNLAGITRFYIYSIYNSIFLGNIHKYKKVKGDSANKIEMDLGNLLWSSSNYNWRNDYWIEGVGSKQDLFYNKKARLVTPDDYQVICVKEKDSVIYYNPWNNEDCYLANDFSIEKQCFGDSTTLKPLPLDDNYASHYWKLQLSKNKDTLIYDSVLKYVFADTGIYTVTLFSVNKFWDTTSISKEIQIIKKPDNFTLGNDTQVCSNSISLSVQDKDYKTLWSTGDTTDQINAPNISGNYWAKKGYNPCYSIDTIHITYLKQVKVNLSPLFELCDGDSIQINPGIANKDLKINWSDGDTAFNKWVNKSDSFLTVKIANTTCGDSAKTIIKVYENPIKTNLSDSIFTCKNNDLKIDLENNKMHVLWNDKDTNHIKTLTDSGKYSYKIVNKICEISDTFNVYFYQNVKVAMDSLFQFCQGDSIQINPGLANRNFDIKWSDGNTDFERWIHVSDTLKVTVNNGCSDSAITVINVIEKPIKNVVSDTFYLCDNEGVKINLGNDKMKVLWSNSDTNHQRILKYFGDYFYTISNGICELKDSLHIASKILSKNIFDSVYHICDGDSILLKINTKSNEYILWNDGDTSSEKLINNSQNLGIKLYNDYCISETSFRININPIPTKIFNIVDTFYCQNNGLTLSLPNNYNYEWNDHDNSPNKTINKAGLYTLKISNNNCFIYDSIQVRESELLPLNLGNDTSFCPISDLMVLTSPYSENNIWLPMNYATKNLNIVDTGNYILIVKNEDGCLTSDTIHISMDCPYYIPTSFTPNNDGLNDVFKIIGNLNIEHFFILNRWGEIIYESNRNFTWDGTYQNKPCEQDMYRLLIDYKDIQGHRKQLKSNITLLR